MQFDNTQVFGFEAAVRGMRNPLESWDQSDSYLKNQSGINKFNTEDFIIGEKDLKLAQYLIKAGSPNDKFMRQIAVWVDITAPLYWLNEHVQYKVGTVSDSTSVMHTGMKRDFTIDDFEIDDDRVYDILSPKRIYEKSCNNIERFPIVYPYETNEWKPYQVGNRKYKVYRNGKVFAEEFVHEDNGGRNGGHRTRVIKEHECNPYQSAATEGYVTVHLGGRSITNNNRLLHRVVAEAWGLTPPDDSGEYFIDHKDGNKGNNSLENLEWVTRMENEKRKKERVYNPWRAKYIAYKNGKNFDEKTREKIKNELNAGIRFETLKEHYGVSTTFLQGIKNPDKYYKNYELFSYCEIWENVLDTLNDLRKRYIETKDESYFLKARAQLPMGFRYKITWSGNYAVLRNMYIWRRNHRLPEWSDDFVKWVSSLPYAKELIMYEGSERNA